MDVVVVGSCNVDLISYVSRLPKPGETIHGSKFSIGFGGKGANQCVCCGRLGAKTAIVCKIGDDTFGKDYLQNLKDNRVDVGYVYVTNAAATGVAPITVTDEGQNSIVIIPGANLLLTEDDVKGAEDLIKSAKVVVCQLEISSNVTKAALSIARQHGVKTILNPAPAQEELDKDFYSLADIFCPNETETELLTGVPVKTVEDAFKALTLLLERGCDTVIITLGENGSVVASKDQPQPKHIPARQVKAIDTTGAGDAFVGGLAFYLSTMPELELAEAIRRAGEIASDSVQRPGTQKSYPYPKDLNSQIFS